MRRRLSHSKPAYRVTKLHPTVSNVNIVHFSEDGSLNTIIHCFFALFKKVVKVICHQEMTNVAQTVMRAI